MRRGNRADTGWRTPDLRSTTRAQRLLAGPAGPGGRGRRGPRRPRVPTEIRGPAALRRGAGLPPLVEHTPLPQPHSPDPSTTPSTQFPHGSWRAQRARTYRVGGQPGVGGAAGAQSGRVRGSRQPLHSAGSAQLRRGLRLGLRPGAGGREGTAPPRPARWGPRGELAWARGGARGGGRGAGSAHSDGRFQGISPRL